MTGAKSYISASADFASGKSSPRDFLEAALAAIDAREGEIEAFAARLDPAINANDPFGADLFDVLEGRAVAVGQHLRDAVMVAQVNEQHTPMVAHPVDPARQADLMAHMGGVQGGAGMAAIGVHRIPLQGGYI